MSEYDYLMQDTPKAEGGDLKRLEGLCAAWKTAKEQIGELEAALEKAKATFNKISQEDIPELLHKSGLSELRLLDGSKVTVKTEVSATVKDIDDFVHFLEARGDDAIVKTSFDFGKLPTHVTKEIQQKIYADYGILPDTKRVIHPQTLKKYIKELCGLADDGVDGMPIGDLPKSVKVFVYNKTNIK